MCKVGGMTKSKRIRLSEFNLASYIQWRAENLLSSKKGMMNARLVKGIHADCQGIGLRSAPVIEQIIEVAEMQRFSKRQGR